MYIVKCTRFKTIMSISHALMINKFPCIFNHRTHWPFVKFRSLNVIIFKLMCSFHNRCCFRSKHLDNQHLYCYVQQFVADLGTVCSSMELPDTLVAAISWNPQPYRSVRLLVSFRMNSCRRHPRNGFQEVVPLLLENNLI